MGIDLDSVATDVARAVPADNKLTQVGELAQRQVSLEAEVADLELILKNRKEDLRTVSEELLPEALLEAGGLTEIRLASGEKISVRPYYSGSISQKNRPAAHGWLRDNGHGDLIKHEIKAAFGKGEEEAAARAASALRDLGVEFSDDDKVHPQTLRAFIREQTEAGVQIPETLGAHVGQRAKISKE